MAKHGIKGIIGGGAAAEGAAGRVMTAWRDALGHVGRDIVLGTDLALGDTWHIAETEAKAIREARPFFEENMKMFAPLGFVCGLSDEQISAIADPTTVRSAQLPTLEQAVQAGSWLCGPPELLIAKLQQIQETYPGLQAVNVGSVIGTPKNIVLEQLEIFAQEVMPAFKKQATAVG